VSPHIPTRLAQEVRERAHDTCVLPAAPKFARGNLLYQGRFKSFPVQEEGYFLTLCRYVERNALRANLVAQAEQWRWSSLWRWHQGNAAQKRMLAPWPIRRSPNWLEFVNVPQTDNELQALRKSVVRGCPFGDEVWSNRIVKRLGLESTLRPRGRPKK